MELLYLIIPFLFHSLQGVILAKFSRIHGSLSVSFYRQLSIFLIGIPLLYFFPINFEILKENLFTICLTSIIGSIFLFINFKSFDYIPVAIGKAFSTSARIIITILVGILVLSDSINIYQTFGFLILIIAIFTLLNSKDKVTPIGIYLSLLAGTLLVANWYYFMKYSTNFNPLIAGYILETFNGIFLLGTLIGKSFITKESINKTLSIDKKTFLILLFSAPLVLIGTAVIAKSYEIFSFTIVGIALTMTLPTTLILSRFILKEKLSLKSIISIIIVTLSVIAIKFFEN